MTAETFFANFGHLADAPNGVQKLRELILQLAVQGKLVPQDPEEEPASKFLHSLFELQKRKFKIVNEVPFNVPDSWQWLFLGDLADIVRGVTYKKDVVSDVPKSGYKPLLRANNINGVLNYHKLVYVPESLISERQIIKKFDLLIAMSSGSANLVGKAAQASADYDGSFGAFCGVVRAHFVELADYLAFYFQTPFYRETVAGEGKGIGINNIGKKQLDSLCVPLPPLEEQKRIVAKVGHLMALCDELEACQKKQQQGRVRLNNAALDSLLTASEPDEFALHWQRISTNFDLLYDHPETIAKLRAAILQLAVQGKLVPQDPNDEPASVLLERIKGEKEGLVKQGKIKKQKPLPAIDEDLAPFVLPSGWAWARFPEVGEFGRGKSKHRPRNDPSLYSGGKYPMVQTGDVARAKGEVRTYTALYNDTGLAQSRLWPKGTMCITIAANIADSAVLGFDACFPDSVVGLIASEEIGDVAYFEYFIRTAKEHLMDFAPSTAQKNINLGILETVFIPLPPLAEMKRIVAKVDQLMALCDVLEAKLNQAQQHSEKLMEATVRQLLVA